jgi:hypothetical protein
MLKGIQKEMVMIRTTDSRLFEMAYFVLRSSSDRDSDRSTIVAEANRIVCDVCGEKKIKSREVKKRRIKNTVLFMGGAVIGAALVISVCFFIGIP